jgi:hypothetical protein
MNKISLELSLVWFEVQFRKFVEQELECAFVFDLAELVVGGAEDLVGGPMISQSSWMARTSTCGYLASVALSAVLMATGKVTLVRADP